MEELKLIMYKKIGDKKTISAEISVETLQNLKSFHGEAAIKDTLYEMFLKLKNEDLKISI